MADLRLQDRLQPSLLDRLRDDNPGGRKQAPVRRTMGMGELRQAVMRDLNWLLNTSSFEVAEDLEGFPYIARSVLNYGMPDLTGCTASSIDRRQFEKRMRQAILDFEPRLGRKSVKVVAETAADTGNTNSLAFRIEAELWAEPVPIQLFLRTEIDLESGDVAIGESLGGD